MKILHLVHQYLPEDVGGTELYTHWLTAQLAHRGHTCTIFYRRPGADISLKRREEPHQVTVWGASVGPVTPAKRFITTFNNQPLTHFFEQVLIHSQPDLVHIQHLMGLPIALIERINQADIPYIITLHDYWWICANAQLITNDTQQRCDGPDRYLNCARCALARAERTAWWPLSLPLAGLLTQRNRLLRQILNRAAGLIAPSQFVADWYGEHGILPGKITVIPHGLPLPKTTPSSNSIPVAKTVPKTDTLTVSGDATPPLKFIYIGGLTWQKGVHCLLEAFAGLITDLAANPTHLPQKEVVLWIAGDETADPTYVAQLRQLAPSQVRFWGRLTRDEVWNLLNQADVFVMPSLWYETFGLVIFEAFAAGLPVIASWLGPLANHIHHQVNGLHFPAGDVNALQQALMRFIAEPDLLPKLQAGIKPVKTIETHTSEIEAFYQSVGLQTLDNNS